MNSADLSSSVAHLHPQVVQVMNKLNMLTKKPSKILQANRGEQGKTCNVTHLHAVNLLRDKQLLGGGEQAKQDSGLAEWNKKWYHTQQVPHNTGNH